MNEILSTLIALLPPGRKHTSGGWESFNAVCCHHRGEKPDSRKRGGIKINSDAWTYHCFNCGFKAGWSPGKPLSGNTKQLFKWLGLNNTDVGKLGLIALKSQENIAKQEKVLNFDLHEIHLPDNCQLLTKWAEQSSDVTPIIEYLLNRGMSIDWYDWMWSPAPGYQDRIIIPFYNDGKIVGYTGRKITDGKPRYLTESQGGYVFNLELLLDARIYLTRKILIND